MMAQTRASAALVGAPADRRQRGRIVGAAGGRQEACCGSTAGVPRKQPIEYGYSAFR